MENLKKFKRIVAFCAILVMAVSCTVLLMKAIAANNELRTMPGSPKQAEAPDNGSYSTPSTEEHINEDEQEIKSLLEAFGKNLQKVSLLAPEDEVIASINENYSDYVTPELLQKWQANPQSAPGRTVSSPWPDRIDILKMERVDENQYTVYGEIIEVTSVELVSGGAAAKHPVTITVKKVNDRWLISGMTIDKYVEPAPVVYENTRYGFFF